MTLPVKSQHEPFFRYWATPYIKECYLGTWYQLRIVKKIRVIRRLRVYGHE